MNEHREEPRAETAGRPDRPVPVLARSRRGVPGAQEPGHAEGQFHGRGDRHPVVDIRQPLVERGRVGHVDDDQEDRDPPLGGRRAGLAAPGAGLPSFPAWSITMTRAGRSSRGRPAPPTPGRPGSSSGSRTPPAARRPPRNAPEPLPRPARCATAEPARCPFDAAVRAIELLPGCRVDVVPAYCPMTPGQGILAHAITAGQSVGWRLIIVGASPRGKIWAPSARQIEHDSGSPSPSRSRVDAGGAIPVPELEPAPPARSGSRPRVSAGPDAAADRASPGIARYPPGVNAPPPFTASRFQLESGTFLREETGPCSVPGNGSPGNGVKVAGRSLRSSARQGVLTMRRKVLVVDDDPYLTTQLRKLLESDELSVDTVSSARRPRSRWDRPISAC